MKKVNVKGFIALCICLLMLLPLSVIAVNADEKYTPIEWSLSSDAKYLYGKDKRYERYIVNGVFYNDARFSFYFKDTVTYNGRECEVYGNSAYPTLVSVRKGDGYSLVFADKEGKKMLDDFVSGKDCIYYFEGVGNAYTVIEKSLVEALDSLYNTYSSINTVRMDASRLQEADVYEVTVHDRLETKAYQHGAVYKMPDGKAYYLCFEGLDNSHFDADGYFSYRSGEVKLIRLDGDALTKVNTALMNMRIKEKNVIYESLVISGYCDIYGEPIESDFIYESPSESEAQLSFWVFFIFIGFIVPIVPLVIGLVLPRLKSLGKERYWYIMAGFAAIWLLASLGILLILII